MKGKNCRQDGLIWGLSPTYLPLKGLRSVHLEGSTAARVARASQTAGGHPRARVCSFSLEPRAFSARMFSSCVITMMGIF